MITDDDRAMAKILDGYPLFEYISGLMEKEQGADGYELTADVWAADWEYILGCYFINEGYDLG